MHLAVQHQFSVSSLPVHCPLSFDGSKSAMFSALRLCCWSGNPIDIPPLLRLVNLLPVLIGASDSGRARSLSDTSYEEKNMKSRTWMWSLSVWLFAALAMPVQA